VRPEAAFAWLALPSGERGEVLSDKAGWLRLSSKNVSWQLFHVLPAGAENAASLDRLAKRPEMFRAALALTTAGAEAER
jgi:hypothetical protein